ncbi:unnamed protein product [Prorocentrum cordatum]|uniref:Ion transport domain-containing protein n=1 Tax=Prorocentrum cordatum TaxID=2364126 RepID=A0ABN9WK13_9DINO|nr:unnamed protein product [Polarella glacialis]
MQPRLFRQRLFELAAECEALCADAAWAFRGSGRSAAAGPAGGGRPPQEATSAEGGVLAGVGGDGAASAPQQQEGAATPSAPGGEEGAAAGSPGGGEGAQRRRGHAATPSAVGGAEDAVPRAPGGGEQVPAGTAVVPRPVFFNSTRSDGELSNLSEGANQLRGGSLATPGTAGSVFSADAEGVTRGRTGRHHLSVHSGSSSSMGEINRTTSAQGLKTFNKAVRKSLATSLAKSSDALASQEDRRPLTLFVTSRYFSLASASLIIMSTLLLGIETQVLSSLSYKGAGSEQLLNGLLAVNYALTSIFAVEVAMRIYVLRSGFFLKERVWNCFDVAILLLALVEIALDIGVRMFSGGGRNPFDNGGMAKMLRLFRLTRLLRLIRTFRQLKPLRMLVHSIIFAGRSVLWALLLLVMIIYVFAVILTQSVTERTYGGN